MIGEHRIRTARKTRWCYACGWHQIEPGQRYLYSSIPPWHEMNNTKTWQTMHVCLRCAEREGYHSSETRKQLEAT